MHPKQSRGLFPALLFAAPHSSPQELKSSSATKVTEGVETVLKWSKVGFSKTGTRHPKLIIAVEFKTRRKWDYYRSSWTCEDLRLLLLWWCVSGRLGNGGCNSWSNWTHQRSFGKQMLQKLTSRLLPDQSETSSFPFRMKSTIILEWDGFLVGIPAVWTSCIWAFMRSRMAPSCFLHAFLWNPVCPSDADELKRRLATVYNEKTLKVCPILWSNFQLH